MYKNIYYRTALFVAFLFLTAGSIWAQTRFFEPVPANALRQDASINRHIKKLTLYTLREAQLRQHLTNAPLEFTKQAAPIALEIPLPNGQTETFEMFESPILAPNIAAQHPEIKTYAGRGKTNGQYTIRISFTAEGFNAIILGIGGDAAYYDKVSNDKSDQVYRVYFASDAERPKPDKTSNQGNKCGVIDLPLKDIFPQGLPNRGRLAAGPSDVGGDRRVFRLAMAANKEFVDVKGAGDVTAAFNVLVAYVGRVNAVYQKELNVTLLLVTGTNAISTNTADYTNSDQSGMLDQNQTRLTALMISGGYDIGHVLGTTSGSGGGIATSPSVCVTADKGKGVSGVGDGSFAAVFDDQLIAHEMGHQFSMSHSYNSVVPVCTTREASTSVEPGAGATIMSYGFTCDENGSDDNYESPYQPFLNFHTISYGQAATYIATTATCFTTTATGNSAPTITTITSGVTIPKSTPFALMGTATDGNSDAFTYSWEGTNIGTETPTASTLLDASKAPFFRSYEPVATGSRTFPRLSAILDGSNTARGDKLPSVGIATTHRLTVRDNQGGVTYGGVTVTIDGNSGPFLETTNLAGSYAAGTSQTITWDVNGTNTGQVNCANIKIMLSTDGGQTFPIILLANTPNDGSESVMLPNNQTTTARIKVEAVGNIFFDISNANFSITAPVVVTPLAINTPAAQSATTNQAKSGNAATELSPSGGTPPYAYSIGDCKAPFAATAPLPGNSLTVNASTGAYSYTAPATAGTYYYCINVCNATPTSCQTGLYILTVTAPVNNSCGNGGVKVCFYGREICIAQYLLPTYLRLGAKLGGCDAGNNTRIGYEAETNDLSFRLFLQAYPNPVQDEVMLEVLAPQSGQATFQVLDLTGKTHQSRSESLTEGLNEVAFRLGKLPAGIYLIQAIDSQGKQAAVRVNKE